MKKRILAFLLAIVFVVGLLPVTALAETAQPEFKKVNMTLSGVLKVNFKVASNGADMSTYSVKVTVGEDVQSITDSTKEGELYVYSADLLAHKMHEEMTVQLMNGETPVGEAKTFTVQDHVDALKELYDGDAELSAMLDAMVNYGTYAAYYANPVGEAPNVSAVETVTAESFAPYAFQINTPNADLKAVASLYLHRACDLRIKFNAEAFDGCKLLVNGEEAATELVGDQVVYILPELLPQDWGTAYCFQVQDSTGAVVYEVEYSVLSYAYSALKRATEAQTGLNGLLKSLYPYNEATITYADANDMNTSVVTPNSTRFLFKNGTNNGYRFVFDTTNSNVKYAVDFINTQFNELSGAKIDYPGTVDQVNWDMSKKYIVVGNHTMFAAAGLEMPAIDLGETGYYIVTKGDSVFIMADENADEAQAYQLAALAFLKAVVGYEMYAADCVSYTVADGKNFTLPDMKIINKPDMDYRLEGNYISVGAGSYGMGNTDNDVFMSVNGNSFHTVLDLLDPSEYYGSHPDWFYLTSQNTSWWDQIVGNQRYDHYQLCFSEVKNDPEALDIIFGNLKSVILANPSLHNIAFGVADNNYICDCDACSANGVAAYLETANALAQMIADDADISWNVKLIIFAYRQYKNAPTGVTAHKNVGVMVAPIEASYNTPIADQAEFADNIKDWANICNHLYIWYYQANFDHYLYPMDSWDVMQPNIQFARDNGADFIFYQNQGVNASHFSKLKDYLEAELTKNADADYDTLVNNFFTNYYGPAAAPMRQFFDALQAHMNASGSNGGYKEAINTTAFWPQAKLQEFMGYINAAYEAVEADGAANAYVYNSRIKLESLFPRFALLSLYSDTATAGIADAFGVDCVALGVTKYNEMTVWADSDYSGWCDHTCSTYQSVQAAKYFHSGATEASAALYFQSCVECGAAHDTATFAVGEALPHEHSYTFTTGTEENEGFDVGVCEVCSETVLVKTDYTDCTPVDVVVGTESALTMPEGFNGTVTGGKFGSILNFEGAVFDTTSIPTMNHGVWNAVDVTFTSEYGTTHTARVPVTLITSVIANESDFQTFATEASNAWAGGTVMYGYYVLSQDIDCSNTTVSAADAWNNGQFYGTLDGRGHKVMNLTAAAYKTGIFGRLHGTVKDIDFTGVKMNANSALFGKITDGSTLTNVTIDVASWATPTDNTYTGILGLSQNQNLVLNNLVINVADGITVPQLIGRTFTGATGNVTVNLGVDASVINYYSTANSDSSGVSELPADSIITVNQKLAQVIDDEIIIEGNTWTQNVELSDGTAAVSFGGQSLNGTVSGGVLTVDLTGITPAGKLAENVIVSVNNNSYTYTNVWHVTQVIDTVAELKALGTACKDSVVTGYYILGGDIDCSTEATMSNGSANTTTNGFAGTFNGRGHVISNITMTWDNATSGLGGLFGKLCGCTIENTVFDNVKLGTNGTLLASGADKNTDTDTNTTLKNLTIRLDSYNTGYGVVVGYSMFNTVGSGIVIDVADGVTVDKLMARDNCNSIGYITATVNLGVGSTITNYYGTTTAKPDTFTVNVAAAPVVETLDVLVAGEETTNVTFTHEALTAGTTDVTINGQTKSVTADNSTLTVDLSEFGVTNMGQYSAVITQGINELTYTEVWYVTQSIDTVTELKVLGAACKAAKTTGYYILGADIDCSGEANMAAGSPGWQANGFSGTFNGRGYTISNITLTYDAATSGYGGLFGNLAGATILNTTFDKVNYASVNVALLGRHSYAKDGVNTTIQDITINISGWGATGEAGLLVSRGTLNTVHNNIVVNVADGLTIHNLLGQEWKSNYGTGIIVNLTAASTITSYYYADTATAQTTPPSIMTVNAPIDVTLDTLVAAEGSTTASFANEDFTEGNATVTINGQTKSAAMENGTLTVDLADFGVSEMGQYDAVIQTAAGKYTYTEVWYVTQSIDTVEELKALGAACKAANTTGYYILGGDIDCSAEANMAVGNPGWQANGFSGTFNGRNKTISNIKMTWDEATSGNGGLFGNLDGCTIKNVVFDQVNYASVNVALLGRHSYKKQSSNNVTLENLTINISNWGATSGEAGLLVSRGTLNTVCNNIVVNVADGVTIHNLLGLEWNSNYGSGITVYLGEGSTITSYYYADTSTAQTTPPSIVKVQ